MRISMNLEQAAKLPTPPDVSLAATAPIEGHQD
jgi:hypothetical protein